MIYLKCSWTLLLLLLIVSCGKKIVDKSYYLHTEYKNQSGYIITIKSYRQGKEYVASISKDGSINQSIELMFGGTPDFILTSDSAKVIYNNSRMQKYKPSEMNIRNLLRSENHTLISEEKGKSKKYLYLFTTGDYDNAETCNGACN